MYQLFTITKTANYRKLEFISSFDDHNGRNEKLTKVTDSVEEKGCSIARRIFYGTEPADIESIESNRLGRIFDFRNDGKNIRQHLKNISPSAQLHLQGSIERVQRTYKYFTTAYGK